jgi:hypothetical protein
MKMQLVPDRWNTRGSTTVPPELIGRIAPTRTEGINLRGVFSFPIEQCAEQLLPSLAATKSRAIVTTKIARPSPGLPPPTPHESVGQDTRWYGREYDRRCRTGRIFW